MNLVKKRLYRIRMFVKMWIKERDLCKLFLECFFMDFDIVKKGVGVYNIFFFVLLVGIVYLGEFYFIKWLLGKKRICIIIFFRKGNLV